MLDPDRARGTTRRALLRNSALGVGALVGGAALVTSDPAEAGAAGGARRIYLRLDGVTGSVTQRGHRGAIAVRTVSWSLTEDIDTLSNEVLSDVAPSLLVLTMDASSASPALLERLFNGHRSTTGKITTYAPGRNGAAALVSTVALTDVHVVGFHQKATSTAAGHGGIVDTVKLTYASLEYDEDDKESTYTVPA
jgi:type VI protein secretion system component Hcp